MRWLSVLITSETRTLSSVCVPKHPRDFPSDPLTLDTPRAPELSRPIYNTSQCDLYPGNDYNVL